MVAYVGNLTNIVFWVVWRIAVKTNGTTNIYILVIPE